MQLDRYLGKPLPDNEYAVGLALGRRIKETPSLGSANLLFMYDGIRGPPPLGMAVNVNLGHPAMSALLIDGGIYAKRKDQLPQT